MAARPPGTVSRQTEIRLRYAAIVESSHDAIISKDLDGVISAWNAAAQHMFGFTEQEAIGQPITIIIPPELYGEEHHILRRLRAGERIESHQTVRMTKAGRRIDVSLTISPLRDSTGRIIGCSKIARDITEARRAEAALRQSEQRLARELAAAKTLQSISGRLISESRPDSLYAQIVGAAMELMAADAASVQMLEGSDQTSLRLLAWRNFHPDSAAFWHVVTVAAGSICAKALRDNARVVVEDVEACEFMAGTEDYQECRRSGIRAVQSTPLRSRSGRPLGMLSTHWRTPHTPTEEAFRLFDALARQAADLIERTLAEEALSKVNQRLIEAHEEECTRIARELHDDINQRLSCVSMLVENLKGSAPVSAVDFGQELTAVGQQIRDVVSDIQALSHRLHSSRMELLGLAEAAAGFCEELSQRQHVTIDARFENIPKALSRDISLCLYRVLQEALQNVVKHCVPRHAQVFLRGEPDAISLTVKDSGSGFEPDEALRGPGLGLTSMRERLKLVGGRLSIQSQKGGGTTVLAVVPLPRASLNR